MIDCKFRLCKAHGCSRLTAAWIWRNNGFCADINLAAGLAGCFFSSALISQQSGEQSVKVDRKRRREAGLRATALYICVSVGMLPFSLCATHHQPTLLRCQLGSWSHRLSLLPRCTSGSWRRSKQSGNFARSLLTRSAEEGWVRRCPTSLSLLLVSFSPVSAHSRAHSHTHATILRSKILRRFKLKYGSDACTSESHKKRALASLLWAVSVLLYVPTLCLCSVLL